MTRIAFVAHLSEISGAGVALLETVSAFRQDYNAHLILPEDGDLARRAIEKGISPVIIPNPGIALTESSFIQKIKLAIQRIRYVVGLFRYLRKEKIDLVYINTSASIFPAVAAKLARLPIAWHIHETLNATDPNTMRRKQIIRRWADGFIYASRSGMAALPPRPEAPNIIALNFVPVESTHESVINLRDNNGVKSSAPLILASGAFRRKGPDILLDALKRLSISHSNLNPEAAIVGPGDPDSPFYRELLATIDAEPLSGRIQFAGLQPSLIPWLARSSVYVSASRMEALPIAIVEAMAAGVPVIATNVGDCADLLDHGQCGWIVPPEDPEALAQAIAEALTNPDTAKTRAQAAQTKILKLYGAKNLQKPLKSFLDDLINKAG